MTAKDFFKENYRSKHPLNDKYDEEVVQWDFIDLTTFAEDYHKEKLENDVEERTERNGNAIASFIEHCKENGLEVPKELYESYFGALDFILNRLIVKNGGRFT